MSGSHTAARPSRPSSPISLAALGEIVPGASRFHGITAAQARTLLLADVTHDSRDAGPGVLFAARPGERVDGHDFVADAVAAGSPAVLVQRRVDHDVPQLVTRSVSDALGAVSAAIHDHPSQELLLLGVTGTSGKTTTTYLLEAILAAAGHRTGLVGTVETRIGDTVVPGVRTTPEATDLQRLFHTMLRAGVDAAAMEVSSHGLALGRVAGSRFAVVGFTNLSHDHLDFHDSLEEYFETKAMLFTRDYAGIGVVNVDPAAEAGDAGGAAAHGASWGRRLADAAPIDVVTISTAGSSADVVAEDLRLNATESRFVARLRSGVYPARVRIPGQFNVANALLALAMAEAAGIDAEVAVEGLAQLQGVPGRMEAVDVGQACTVLVDYAHKPDALAKVLATARGLTDGRLIVVVGCGGDRDAGKRPEMGKAAAALADVAVLTSDNPRSEEPHAILADMAVGANTVPDADVRLEVDRRAAIGLALDAAEAGDVVVIAGKGHETYQELAQRTVPFDDRAVAREHLLAGGAS